MKKSLIIIMMLVTGWSSLIAQMTIAEARTAGVGQTVTVTGVVTNGAELGPIRYFQDATGGLAAYSATLGEVKRGDEITVTGVIKDYNTLLEIDPVTSFTINSTGNPSPEAVTLTPAQQVEQYEGMLVRIENVDFDASGSFERSSYTYMADGEAGQIYINSTESPLIGTVIPTNKVTVIGPLGSYGGAYQLLPRDQFDILSSSVINFTSLPVMSNLSTSGFTVDWTSDASGTTQAFYGNTPELELGIITVPGSSTVHSIDFSDLQPSELIYMEPFSVLGTDTARSAVQVYITQSVSSGDMKAYFNRPVNSSVSLGLLEAKYLNFALDDTLIAYINRATESIDFTIYNFNNSGLSNISDALNSAYNRGVTVRVIYDSNIDAVGVQTLNAGIGTQASPKSEYPFYGIMHNKFIVFDADADDPDLPIVWTGATNFTYGQMNTDPNNVIVVQDKSLAKAFQLEFNEMFGSDGSQPNAAKAKFGPDKKDNTPHHFIVNGKRVECYFSPSDGTHTQIRNTIASADHEIFVATMLITKADIGYDLRDKNDDGVDVKVLINDFDEYGEPIVNTLKASLGEDIRVKGESGIMHHKYMIIDQGHADSDPILLTGSHNWSASAQFRNDENTLIIHDQGVANAYYQEFVNRFANGQLVVPKPDCVNDFLTMYGGSQFRYDVMYNDYLPGGVSAVTIAINKQPGHGTAQVETDKTISYFPEPTFNQAIDTVGYKVCLSAMPGICDSALMVIYVNKPVGTEDELFTNNVYVYPNPATAMIQISVDPERAIEEIQLLDQSGRLVVRKAGLQLQNTELDLSGYAAGIYYLRLQMDGNNRVVRKIAIQ